MTDEEFRNLKEGDIIRHKHRSEGVMVVGGYGEDVKIIARIQTAIMPNEWDLVLKASYERRQS